MKIEEHMDDQESFEWAMFRARMKAEEEGRNPTFREMLDEAQKELEEEHARLVQQIAANNAASDKASPEADED